MEKHYIVCLKENKLSNTVNLDNFVLKSDEKSSLAEYLRKLTDRAKKMGFEVKSGITEDGRVFTRFENSCKIMKLWFCNKSQAKSMLVEI